METSTPPGKVEKVGLFHSNQVEAFNYAEQRAAVAARIATCVSRAFQAIGASSATQELVYWKVSVSRNMGRNEIADKAQEFIEGIRDVFGEAGTAVFEYMLGREIKREFNLRFPLLGVERRGAKEASEVLQLIRYLVPET